VTVHLTNQQYTDVQIERIEIAAPQSIKCTVTVIPDGPKRSAYSGKRTTMYPNICIGAVRILTIPIVVIEAPPQGQ
jgi:hypothetical protein